MIFADDTKLFNMVSDIQGYKQLREDLDKLLDWSETWQLHFNQGKYKDLHFGRNNSKKTYYICNTTLEVVREEKDLGVIIDDQLTFHKHIATAVKKANRMLGLIKSTFACHDVDILPRLYTSLVRPHLESGNTIWAPQTKKDEMLVEAVQRRATKAIPELKDIPYEDRLINY